MQQSKRKPDLASEFDVKAPPPVALPNPVLPSDPDDAVAVDPEAAERAAALKRKIAQNMPVAHPSAKELEALFRLQNQRARIDRLKALSTAHPEVRELMAENARLAAEVKALKP